MLVKYKPLPFTIEELNFNVKKRYFERPENYKTLEQFKKYHLNAFLTRLEQAKHKKGINIPPEEKDRLYRIIFEYGFYNARKEYKLYEFLNGFGKAVYECGKRDYMHKVDISFVNNLDKVKYFIQVKPSQNAEAVFSKSAIIRLYNYALKNHAIPLLAIWTKEGWKFGTITVKGTQVITQKWNIKENKKALQ